MDKEDNRPFKLKVPKDMPDYILKALAKESYLIYSKKDDICYCTRCQRKMKISQTIILPTEFQHNKLDFCPNCRCDVTMKAFGIGRRNIDDCGRVLWLTKHGRDTYAELDEYIIRYDGFYRPSVGWWPSAQYKFNSDEQIYYKNDWYSEGDVWTLRKKVILPHVLFGSCYYENQFENVYLYEPSRNNLGTDLKYANLDMERLGYDGKSTYEPYWIITYISQFLMHQSIELMEKAGFERLVGGKIIGNTCKYINWRGKTIKKILKFSAEDIRYMRENKITIGELNKIGYVMQEIPGMKMSEATDLTDVVCDWRYKFVCKKISKYTDKEKMIRYIASHGITHIGDYEDYFDACEKLGENLYKKSILFPENFKLAHADATKRLDIKVSKKIYDGFIKSEARITGMKEPYVYGEYLIRPAKDPTELKIESAVLGHCVKTYAEKVANGSTSILFIRKLDKPDEPLFTLELDAQHRMVQCRGLHNCSYGDDVKELIDHWMQDIIEKKKKKPARKAA